MLPQQFFPLKGLHLLFVQIFYLCLSLWRYYFLGFFRIKVSVSERHDRTCSLVWIHDKNSIIIFEKSCTVQIIQQDVLLYGAQKPLAQKDHSAKNDSAYMIFLAYRYLCYIQTAIWLKTSILILWYHLQKSKEQKKKKINQKKIKFPLAWCSWIFDMMPDGWDTTIVKFTHKLFPCAWYWQMLHPAPPKYGVI